MQPTYRCDSYDSDDGYSDNFSDYFNEENDVLLPRSRIEKSSTITTQHNDDDSASLVKFKSGHAKVGTDGVLFELRSIGIVFNNNCGSTTMRRYIKENVQRIRN